MEYKTLVKETLNYMHNTGLHPVAAAHMIVGRFAEHARYEPESRDMLYRVGRHLCKQERDILIGIKPAQGPWLENVFGSWPGDETDAELLALLAEIRA